MKKIFNINGMHCTSCSKIIEMDLDGKVNSSKVDFKSGKAVIDFDPKKITEAEIKKLIEERGYRINN